MKKHSYGYQYFDAEHTYAHAYLLPALEKILNDFKFKEIKSLMDVGCGNGSLSQFFSNRGMKVVGIDSSEDGIRIAKESHQKNEFYCKSISEEPLADWRTNFDAIISLEVIEHLFYPRDLFRFSGKCLREDGLLIISTPYHGYLKNLALSLLNAWDKHFSVGWDGGHIKFFSKKTLREMLEQEGFQVERFYFSGRFMGFWKSMICVARTRNVVTH